MKRTRHKRVPSVCRRALQIIAANPDGCTEAMLAALDIPADILIELVRGGLVIVRRETVVEEDSADEVTKVWVIGALGATEASAVNWNDSSRMTPVGPMMSRFWYRSIHSPATSSSEKAPPKRG